MIADQSYTSAQLETRIYETNAEGARLKEIGNEDTIAQSAKIRLLPDQTYQTITGFGGSFTQASAHVLGQLSQENQAVIIEAYFGDSGARYSLTRTHMNSCDFSLRNYSYAQVEGDRDLKHFSIAEDKEGIIPMIKMAQAASEKGFNIISSPWTAPPWMKDNRSWIGGRLLEEYYETWARFFVKYLEAYKKEGIDIWGVTVENEPHGNGNNWESMHYTPEEMTMFVRDHLGPVLQENGLGLVNILGYDQNRANLDEWVDEMFRDELNSRYYAGTAIHWYSSTYEVFADQLQYAHQKAPQKHLIQTEACVDSEPPRWKDDLWYWSKEATDWGWDWAMEHEKYLHPKYAPVHRYAMDIIGCLNNWVDGWIDWNMVLNRQGGPNWSENWCTAPVIADVENDEVYFTPLYFTLSHFSRFIRPGARRIGFELSDESLFVTAALNPDRSIIVVVFNPTMEKKHYNLCIGDRSNDITINQQALQTIEVLLNQPNQNE